MITPEQTISSMKTLIVVCLLILTGCGTPAKQVTTNPPPGNGPMTGTFLGGMNFTIVTGSLSIVMTEDSSGNLTGTASSNPPDCQFDLPVAGQVNQLQMWLQTKDTTTVSLAGTIAGDLNSVSGNVNLGSSTGCGPRTGGTFTMSRN